jgi:DNA-binding NtrC family response regulator
VDERWTEIDLPALLTRGSQPIFVLNERGILVYANAALHEAFRIPFGNRIGWRTLEIGALKPPHDLPVGGARQLDVQLPSGDWMQAIFHSLQDANAGIIGVLGVLRPIAAVPAAPESDANLFARWERLREDQRLRYGLDLFPARSEAGAKLLHQVKIAAPIDSPVTLVGEPGVGKLTLAKAIHHRAKDRGWSATLDAEALGPEEQVEFLFGEQGVVRQPGPGRIIVRRLLSLSPDAQRSLVEAMQTQDRQWRLLATEREPLEAALADGRLHPPLYFQATHFTIAVPSLRERRDDLGDFAANWLKRRQVERGGALIVPTAAAVDVMERYDWPGNLREFELVMASAADKAAGGVLDTAHLPPRLIRGSGLGAAEGAVVKSPPLDEMLERLERRMLRQARALFKGNKTKAAEHLGLSRARFIRRWEQLKLDEAEDQGVAGDDVSSDDSD